MSTFGGTFHYWNVIIRRNFRLTSLWGGGIGYLFICLASNSAVGAPVRNRDSLNQSWLSHRWLSVCLFFCLLKYFFFQLYKWTKRFNPTRSGPKNNKIYIGTFDDLMARMGIFTQNHSNSVIVHQYHICIWRVWLLNCPFNLHMSVCFHRRQTMPRR